VHDKSLDVDHDGDACGIDRNGDTGFRRAAQPMRDLQEYSFDIGRAVSCSAITTVVFGSGSSRYIGMPVGTRRHLDLGALR